MVHLADRDEFAKTVADDLPPASGIKRESSPMVNYTVDSKHITDGDSGQFLCRMKGT